MTKINNPSNNLLNNSKKKNENKGLLKDKNKLVNKKFINKKSFPITGLAKPINKKPSKELLKPLNKIPPFLKGSIKPIKKNSTFKVPIKSIRENYKPSRKSFKYGKKKSIKTFLKHKKLLKKELKIKLLRKKNAKFELNFPISDLNIFLTLVKKKKTFNSTFILHDIRKNKIKKKRNFKVILSQLILNSIQLFPDYKETKLHYHQYLLNIINDHSIIDYKKIIIHLKKMMFLILKLKNKKKKILLIENSELKNELRNDLKILKKRQQIITHNWIPGILSNRIQWNKNKKYFDKGIDKKPRLIIAFNDLNNTFIKEAYTRKVPIIVLTRLNLTSNYSTYKIPYSLNKDSIYFFIKLLRLVLK